jgi:hypothetical protein
MRTAEVCPTCPTYENALCIIYNGPLLPITDISPGDSVEVAFGKIEALFATLTTTTTTTTTSSTTTTTTTIP